MFWNKAPKSTPAAEPAVHNVNDLEKGSKQRDRASSFSSTSSSSSNPIKSHLTVPDRAFTNTQYSQAESSVGLSSVDSRSFPHIESSSSPRKNRKPPGFFRRHWFLLTIIVLATLGIGLGVMAALIKSSKRSRELSVYIPEGHTVSGQFTGFSEILELATPTVESSAEPTDIQEAPL